MTLIRRSLVYNAFRPLSLILEDEEWKLNRLRSLSIKKVWDKPRKIVIATFPKHNKQDKK